MASLDSPRAKFDRAREQCNALSRDLSTLYDLKFYTITKEVDNATGNQIYSFTNVPPIPDDLSLRIGEMLYNFRCSLDHLVWQLVLSEGNTPTIRNEFPIFIDVGKYEAEKGNKLKGVSNAVVAIVDSLQPCYSTMTNDCWWYLWYLHELCNAEKHRHLLLTRQTLGRKLRLSWTSTKAPKARYLAVPVEVGAVFLILKPNMDVHGDPTIQILFSNTPSNVRADLPVESIISLISAAVYKVFERLSPHIK